MKLDNYLAKRRYFEVAFAALLILISFVANLGIVSIDYMRNGVFSNGVEPLVLEATSHAAIALSLPLLIWFERRFPIRLATLRSSVLAHALFSVVFSLSHVTLMYWSRVLIFGSLAAATPYHWDNWPGEFGYEYLKDFRSYLLILAIIYLYRFVLMRLQGEAGFLAENREEQETAAVSDRFLVKKLGREFLVRVNEIDWIESCGNYVNLHVGSRVYPLRETMTRIDERLVPMGFQRVHRSAIVNLERVSEIIPFETGDGQAKLQSDAVVPVSRRFRQELRDRLV